MIRITVQRILPVATTTASQGVTIPYFPSDLASLKDNIRATIHWIRYILGGLSERCCCCAFVKESDI
jgi:hypothetical protein